jgi:hypothetical protein
MLRPFIALVVLLLLSACASTPPSKPAAPVESEMTADIPGGEHAALAPFVGSFKARVALEIPGQPEQVSHGSYDVRWMGKMWLVGTYKSDSVNEPFEGQALIGYDLATRQYTTWWFDTETSAPQLSRGTWDPKSGQMIMHTDPVRGMPAMRVVTKVNPDGSIKSEAFGPGKSTPEVRVMYIEYTRR